MLKILGSASIAWTTGTVLQITDQNPIVAQSLGMKISFTKQGSARARYFEDQGGSLDH